VIVFLQEDVRLTRFAASGTSELVSLEPRRRC
jgi:hypothetical protein